MPSSRSSRASVTSASRGARSGSRSRDLRSDVAVQADDLDARGGRACRRQISRASSIAHAELVGLEAGRDVRMAAARRCRGSRAARRGRASAAAAAQRVDALDLAFRLRVDACVTPRSMACASSAVGLADAGEDDLRGMKPARSATSISPPEFASAPAAERRAAAARSPASSSPSARSGARADSRERLVDRAVAVGDGRGAVDVERRAVSGGEVGERHAVARAAPRQPLK